MLGPDPLSLTGGLLQTLYLALKNDPPLIHYLGIFLPSNLSGMSPINLLYSYSKSVSDSGVLALARYSPPQGFFMNKPCAGVSAVPHLSIQCLFQSNS
jgi:hypothetical protein